MLEQYSILTAPSGDVVTLAEVKSYLRVTTTVEDSLIQTLINSAVVTIGNITSQIFLTTEFLGEFGELKATNCECFPFIQISKSPFQDLTSIYVVKDSINVELDSDSYEVIKRQMFARILFKENLPGHDDIIFPLKVVFNAGYEDSDSIPGPLKLAIFKLVNFNYRNRGECGKYIPEEILNFLKASGLILMSEFSTALC